MNKYLKKAMDETSNKLPKTFEEYGKMHTADARSVPFAHVQKLRNEFDQRKRNEIDSLKPINFD